jgi:hypothetical protein
MSNPRPLPPLHVLKALFKVDSSLPSGLSRMDGTMAGTAHSGGRYWYAKVNAKRFACHRIIMALVTGIDAAGLTVDHVNRDGLDNRSENLRWATPVQQAENRRSKRMARPGKWGYRWVTFDKNGFVARYTLGGKEHYAGRFKSALKAHCMACAHRLETFWQLECEEEIVK